MTGDDIYPVYGYMAKIAEILNKHGESEAIRILDDANLAYWPLRTRVESSG